MTGIARSRTLERLMSEEPREPFRSASPFVSGLVTTWGLAPCLALWEFGLISPATAVEMSAGVLLLATARGFVAWRALQRSRSRLHRR